MADLAATLVATDADRLLQAEALVRAYCGWHIAPERTETVEVRAAGGRSLLLPSMYVTAVESVVDNSTPLTVEIDYIWSAAGVITRAGCWGYDVVAVEITHGYSTVPLEVTAVVQALASRAIANPGSLTSKTIGPFSESYSTSSGQVATLSLLDAEKDILRRYRIPAVA